MGFKLAKYQVDSLCVTPLATCRPTIRYFMPYASQRRVPDTPKHSAGMAVTGGRQGRREGVEGAGE